MSYTINCGDVMPGCPARFDSEDRDDLMGQVADHARDQHGLTEITPEVADQVSAAVRTT